jgi:hypothetical protein
MQKTICSLVGERLGNRSVFRLITCIYTMYINKMYSSHQEVEKVKAVRTIHCFGSVDHKNRSETPNRKTHVFYNVDIPDIN